MIEATFADSDLTFADVPVSALHVDATARTISGVALPFGKVGVRGGRRFKFAPGSLRWSAADVGRVKLLREHRDAIGKAVQLSDDGNGLRVVFKVGRGKAGDEALGLAEDGVLDSFSVGVDFEAADVGPDPAQRGVTLIQRADLREVSLTALPSFEDARVESVAASRDDEGGHITFADAGDDGPTPVSPLRANDRTNRDEGPPPLMPNRAQIEELHRATFERRPVRIVAEREPGETFAVVTVGTDVGRPATHLPGAGRLSPLRIADLVGLPTDNVGWGGQARFPIFGAGAAGVAAEGAAKTEYDNVNPGDATPVTLNVWTDITGQAQSVPSFEAKLRNKLARLIATLENEQLRAKVAGTVGINTQAFTAGDQAVQILRAAASIEAVIGVRPDLLLFNPADTAAIFGTAVSNAAPQEIAALSVRIFGMIGLPLSTQPAGFVLVGAWAAGSTFVVGNGLTFMVDPFTQMKNNVVTVLAEEAVDLAVEEPPAFTSVDIVTP